jgi:hypothetical protein
VSQIHDDVEYAPTRIAVLEEMSTMIRAAIAAGLLAVSLASCTSENPSAVGPVNTKVWVKDSHPVSSRVIETFPGPPHCFSQGTVLLTLGWPLGTPAASLEAARWYVRNPDGWPGPDQLMSTFDPSITPPLDARSTGYQNGTFELWLAPSDEDVAAYVKVSGQFERWPRAKQALMCQ